MTDLSLMGNSKALILTVVLLVTSSIVSSSLRAWYRLHHVKGPFWAGFSKLWLIRHVGGGSMHIDLWEVCQKYGSLARIGPNDLVTCDPGLLRRMLGVRTTYKRSDWYDGMRLDPSRDNVLSERNDELHNQLRAKMAAGTESKPFDFGKKAQFFTLDTISDVAFGAPFGDLASDEDVHEYIKTTEETLPAIIMVTVLPWLNWVLQLRILKSLLPSEKDPLGIGKVMGIAKEVVGKRFGPDKIEQRDMLGSFVRHGLTQSEAESETLVQILAGSDTTATAIRSSLLHIITNPRVTKKLLAEISTAEISSPITDAEAKKLPYLQAVIKEGLRIFPPVTGLMSKVVPPGGDTINGLFIPEGTKIGYCAWGVFRDEKIWGEDSKAFRPERWLEGSAEKIKEQEATLELIFGYGRWQCLGKNVALIELNKVYVELLRHFELEIVDPTRPWKSVNVGIFMQSEMWLKATRRENTL